MKYTITDENYLEANAAMRDILFMYRDLIESYHGFGHGIDTGTFSSFDFVDTELLEEPSYSLDMDMNLLRQGSAVALLCGLSDFWDESEGDIAGLGKWGEELRDLLKDGRLDHLPLAKEAVEAGLESEDNLRALLPGVYREYVVGYFE